MAYPLLRPLLFALDAETSHHTTLSALSKLHALGLTRLAARKQIHDPRQVIGLTFANAVGLGAGLDKNADHIDALAALGFGFIEVGTVTPRPQPGNPKPRLFRLPQGHAIINRMGFNNLGAAHMLERLKATSYRGVLGVNIGKNFDTPIAQAADDYLYCLRAFYPHASYITVNISSPNTRDLRDLQRSSELAPLLAALKSEQAKLSDTHGKYVPLAVKIAPDLDDEQIAAIAALLIEHRIDAVIATNTTVTRDGVAGQPHATEIGGLSGAPLTLKSRAVVAALSRALAGALPIIGVGGITNGHDATDMMKAGASLVQLYSGLIYRGPALIAETVRATATMRR